MALSSLGARNHPTAHKGAGGAKYVVPAHSAYHHQDSAAVIEEGEEDELPKQPGSARTLYYHGYHLLPAALQPTSQPHVKMRKLPRVSPQVGCHLANVSAE